MIIHIIHSWMESIKPQRIIFNQLFQDIMLTIMMDNFHHPIIKLYWHQMVLLVFQLVQIQCRHSVHKPHPQMAATLTANLPVVLSPVPSPALHSPQTMSVVETKHSTSNQHNILMYQKQDISLRNQEFPAADRIVSAHQRIYAAMVLYHKVSSVCSTAVIRWELLHNYYSIIVATYRSTSVEMFI